MILRAIRHAVMCHVCLVCVATCCLLGDFVDWTEAQCDPVCGSDRYQIRKRRRLQNPVPNVDNEFDPTCDLNKCKQDSESAESRRCRNVPECSEDARRGLFEGRLHACCANFCSPSNSSPLQLRDLWSYEGSCGSDIACMHWQRPILVSHLSA